MATKPRAPRAKAAAAAPNVVSIDAARGPTMLDAAAGGLSNLVTGMGAQNGRRDGDVWFYEALPEQTLMAMYRSNWMARKAVEIPADDMTQKWRQWQAKPNQVTALCDTEKRLKVSTRVREALGYARLYGGGAIIIGDGNDVTKPLEPDNLKKGGLKYLIALPRQNLTVHDKLNWNPAAENFGLPEFFQLSLPGSGGAPQQKVHWSRVAVFKGNPSGDMLREQDCYGDSILQAIAEAVVAATIANASAATLMEEAKVDVIQMDNLEHQLQSTESNSRLMTRLQLAKLGKSSFGMLLMGGKEKFDSKQVNFGSMDKVLLHIVQVVSGAADIPATRFLAQSPAGMNATGESDLRNYGTMIRAQQDRVLGDAMERLDRLLIRDALGREPKDVSYEWRSIWEPSPKEAAETNYINSQADTNYANAALIPLPALAIAVQTRMGESTLYPGLQDAIRELTPEELEMTRPEPLAPPIDPNKQPPEPGNAGE